jgi:DNA repair protein RadC
MSQKIESMSDIDVLSLLVGYSKAVLMLQGAGGSLSQLLHEPLPQAYAVPNLAPRIKAVTELVRRSMAEVMAQRDVLTTPAAVRTYLRLQMARLQHEVFVVLFLDSQNRVIASEEMFRGTLTQTSVYPREVVKRALELNAAAVILAHNHPSGSVEPSRADEALTQTLRAALALVDARVLDHFIVAGNGSAILSMAERGLV